MRMILTNGQVLVRDTEKDFTEHLQLIVEEDGTVKAVTAAEMRSMQEEAQKQETT